MHLKSNNKISFRDYIGLKEYTEDIVKCPTLVEG